MPRASIATGLLVAFLLRAPGAQGQKATEQFIPIGQSPGLSNVFTDLAAIAEVDADARTITLPVAGGRRVKVTEGTTIWLDRSKYRQSNVVGGFEDLRVGLQVEVKYEDSQRREMAEWIKVALEPGN